MLKILVVEDEGVLAMALCHKLRGAGYQVCRPAATGEQAIQIIAEEAPDVILMDIRLPGAVDGLETAQQIRAAAQTPIIFMSGYSGKSVRRRALELQPAAYLIKPVELADLEPLLRKLMLPPDEP